MSKRRALDPANAAAPGLGDVKRRHVQEREEPNSVRKRAPPRSLPLFHNYQCIYRPIVPARTRAPADTRTHNRTRSARPCKDGFYMPTPT
jgi:hypothetical protein